MVTHHAISRVCRELSTKFVAALLDRHLCAGDKPVLIQCGHFSLFYDRSSSRLLPDVEQRLPSTNSLPESRTSPAVGIFPTFTWDLGAAVAQALHMVGIPCSITTIVNDWQLLKGLDTNLVSRLRRSFYAETSYPPSSYSQTGNFRNTTTLYLGYFSEYFLRRRFERRVSRLAKLQPSSGLVWKGRGAGSRGCLLMKGGDVERPVLQDGKSNCAGEVAEWIFIASALGYKVLINIYPLACLEPVHQGAALAFELDPVALESTIMIQIGLYCSGEQSADELLSKGVKASIQTSEHSAQLFSSV